MAHPPRPELAPSRGRKVYDAVEKDVAADERSIIPDEQKTQYDNAVLLIDSIARRRRAEAMTSPNGRTVRRGPAPTTGAGPEVMISAGVETPVAYFVP